MELDRENVIKLSIIGGVVLIVLVVAIFMIRSGPKVVVVEDAPVSDPGTGGSDRVRPGTP